jgi:uncharacterized coiled-coil protein SlyX
MKLKDLRAHTSPNRWAEPGAMRWNLDLGSLVELREDIDEAIQRARQEGEKHAHEKLMQTQADQNLRMNEAIGVPTARDMRKALGLAQGVLTESERRDYPTHALYERLATERPEGSEWAHWVVRQLKALENVNAEQAAKLQELDASILHGVASDNDQDKRLAWLERKLENVENLQRAHNELNGVVHSHRGKLDSDNKRLQYLEAQAQKHESELALSRAGYGGNWGAQAKPVERKVPVFVDEPRPPLKDD